VGLSIPASAIDFGKGTDISFDGRIGFNTYWTKTDAPQSRTGYDDTEIGWGDNFTDSRLRAWFRKGPLTAKLEIEDGVSSGVFNSWFAEWNFGPGFLWIGKDDPLTFFPSDQISPPPQSGNAGKSVGGPKADAIRLRFPMGPVTLSVQAMTPNTGQQLFGTPVVHGPGAPAIVDTDMTIPRFEAKLDFVIGPLAGMIMGGYNTYSEVTSVNKEYDIDSNMIGLGLIYPIGPLRFEGTIIRDSNSYTDWPPPFATESFIPVGQGSFVGNPTYDPATDEIVDATNTAWHLSAGYQVNDMLAIKAGYGENDAKQDAYTGVPEIKEKGSSYWITLPIGITEFFKIIPFYNSTDYKHFEGGGVSGPDMGKVKSYGLHWEIVF